MLDSQQNKVHGVKDEAGADAQPGGQCSGSVHLWHPVRVMDSHSHLSPFSLHTLPPSQYSHCQLRYAHVLLLTCHAAYLAYCDTAFKTGM